jgi:DNA polymerase bacteriophage-type
MDLRIDLETYSSYDLKKTGVFKYVEAPDFEVMLFGFKFGSGPATVVDLASGEQIPPHILKALEDPAIRKKAYNAQFEIVCLSKHLGGQLDPEQWDCTSLHALYLGMPGNLGDVCKVLDMPEDKRKLGTGRALIRYFCMPCKPTKSNGGRTRNLPRHDPQRWQLFKEYCAQDVEAEAEAARRLSHFPVPERVQRGWVLDQRMHAYGVLIDEDLVDAAIECDELIKNKLLTEAEFWTGLDNPNSRGQLLEWLRKEEGDEVTDLTKKTVPKVLQGTSNEVVRRVLELRMELAKTSVSKYHAMKRAVCADGRLRGLTQFYGANRTGRQAGRIVQVQNLPQNKLKDINLARDLLKSRDYDTLEMLFGTPADTLSQLIRTAFVATPGTLLAPVDFSAIEARIVAWLSWCQWRVDVFNSHGKIYEASAEQMFKLPPGSVTKKSPYRQKGKIAELALGYLGGVGALVNMGALDMGLPQDELQPIVDAWRAANPEILNLAYSLERAAKTAITSKIPVKVPVAGGRANVTFVYEKAILFMELPSGRRLAYVKARVEPQPLMATASDGTVYEAARAGAITYEGTDQRTKRWGRITGWAGKWLENLTQAVAYDALLDSMLRLDANGFRQLFSVHDEVICEITNPEQVDQIQRIMGQSLHWAPDLPLPAEGFSTPYYMKEID